MIERLLKRFNGAASYEEGIEVLYMADVKSKGPTETTMIFTQKDVINEDTRPLPILATLKTRKEQIPYADEYPLGFNVEYINQEDETHIGYCFIDIYAEKDLDFRVFMQEDDDFVKEITNITPREDKTTLTLVNALNTDEFVAIFGELIGFIANGKGWNSEDGEMINGVVSIDGTFKYTCDSSGNSGSSSELDVIPIEDYWDTTLDTVEQMIIKAFRNNPFHYLQYEKLYRLTGRVKLTTDYQYINVSFKGNNGLFVKTYTTSSSYYSLISAIDPNIVELITVDVWYDIAEDIADIVKEEDNINFNINKLYYTVGIYDAPDMEHNWYIDYISYHHYNGDLGDEVEIIGLKGNISRVQAAKALVLSDVAYQIRVASLQRYVDIAYRSGLTNLSKDFGIYLSNSFTQDITRLFTRLFSTFVVPAKSIMQESMTIIYSTLDPLGYVVVYADYDNPYKMIVDVYRTLPEFTETDIEILLLFIDRYRPVPADVDVNIILYDKQDDTDIVETGVLNVYSTSTCVNHNGKSNNINS